MRNLSPINREQEREDEDLESGSHGAGDTGNVFGRFLWSIEHSGGTLPGDTHVYSALVCLLQSPRATIGPTGVGYPGKFSACEFNILNWAFVFFGSACFFMATSTGMMIFFQVLLVSDF